MCEPDPKSGDVVLFNKDFVAFLVSVALAFFFFTGFSYRAAYFKVLGVPLSSFEIDFLELVSRGLYLQAVWWVALGTLVIFGCLLRVYIWANQSRPMVHYGAMAALFVGATYGAGFLGDRMGAIHARALTIDGAGISSICGLREDIDMHDDQRKIFEALSITGRLKRVADTEKFVFFAVASADPDSVVGGQSIAVAKSDIAFCRSIGVRGW